MPTTNVELDHQWRKVASADEHVLISSRTIDHVEYATSDDGPPTVFGHLYRCNQKLTRNDIGPGDIYARVVYSQGFEGAVLIISKSAVLQ